MAQMDVGVVYEGAGMLMSYIVPHCALAYISNQDIVFPQHARLREDMYKRTLSREQYTIGIVCALSVEQAAVVAMLDEEHGRVQKAASDENVYTFGRAGEHNVVVACLPAGMPGRVSATVAAQDMMRSFPIKAGFMVGVSGGVWSESMDIRLGDVVVSKPDGKHGGVVQWDYGKMERDGTFWRIGTLNKPPRPLLNALQSLRALHWRKGNQLHQSLKGLLSNNPYMAEEYRHPGAPYDERFEANYEHGGGDTCSMCDRSHLCDRQPRTDDEPKIHYGNIASSDQAMECGRARDRIAGEEGILCFEMEAAGLMDTFPCLVIRGVCNYADSHKNERWQPYAAAMAACYAKELLAQVESTAVGRLELASKSLALIA
jgi:nucleoside phosphorylase